MSFNMKVDEGCQLCLDTVTVACEQFGRQNPEYCVLKEKYITDSTMGTSEVISELTRISTPEQLRAISDALVEKGMADR